MDKLASTSYKTMIPYIDKTTCGVVYPLSIVESTQRGEVYTDGNSALFWHYSGFAFLYGVCDDNFLNCVYENFLSADSVTSRRFILFATNEPVKRFFGSKDNVVSGKRYFFEYPNSYSSRSGALPANLEMREINGELFDKTEGTVTPRFSWANSSEFLDKGKGYCITDGKRAVAWAFSAAVSADEIDIGIETRVGYRHLGLGTAVAEQMIKYCFEQHKRPVWACNASNAMSQRLAEKLGFLKVSECDTFRKF